MTGPATFLCAIATSPPSQRLLNGQLIVPYISSQACRRPASLGELTVGPWPAPAATPVFTPNSEFPNPNSPIHILAPMHLVLIGYRGAGKSTVAKRLASRLGWDWADVDVEIEQAAGKSIAAVFAEDGETAFRDLESQQFTRLIESDPLVLAAGGGIVLRSENREVLKRISQSGGHVIWLQALPEIIQQRMSADRTTASRRPNLTASGGLREIVELLQERAPLYKECATLAIDTEGKDPGQIAAEILDRLQLLPKTAEKA